MYLVGSDLNAILEAIVELERGSFLCDISDSILTSCLNNLYWIVCFKLIVSVEFRLYWPAFELFLLVNFSAYRLKLYRGLNFDARVLCLCDLLLTSI